jgi:HK97 gp10 family phage protein
MANLFDDVQGLPELLAKLESVSQDIKKKGGRFALRKAANIVAKAAKQNSESIDDPETGRSISKNIALRWDGKRFRRTGDLGFRVGVQHGAVLKRGTPDLSSNAPTPHWRLLEFGTQKMAAQPFMRRALEENVGVATQTFVTEYKKALDRAIRRAART